MNHAGPLKPDLLVVLNDNKMSISENVGALSLYFARVLSGPHLHGAARGQQEDPAAHAGHVGTRASAPRST